VLFLPLGSFKTCFAGREEELSQSFIKSTYLKGGVLFMKKKLSISILAILLVGVLAFGAVAYFSDTEALNGNTFTAGKLDLQLQNPVNLAFISKS
jgi:predicted ribosomally synthesized peptide with SipW-like signal peptide